MSEPTVDQPAAEREPDNVTPDVRHFAALADAYTTCGLERATVRWTDDPETPVDCPECAGKLVDEQLVERGPDPETSDEQDAQRPDGCVGCTYLPGPDWGVRVSSPRTCPVHGDQPAVEPERRTVSLEVLTDELRRVGSPEGVPDDARVGVILRRNGKPVVVADTDRDWRAAKHGDEPVWVLRGMLTEAIFGVARLEREHGHDVELLMPTPDVLAALDGRDAQLLTAPVWVLALDVEPGMYLAPVDGPMHLVTETAAKCTSAHCEEGASCVVFLVDGKEQHGSGYARTRVRIPVSVTR